MLVTAAYPFHYYIMTWLFGIMIFVENTIYTSPLNQSSCKIIFFLYIKYLLHNFFEFIFAVRRKKMLVTGKVIKVKSYYSCGILKNVFL